MRRVAPDLIFSNSLSAILVSDFQIQLFQGRARVPGMNHFAMAFGSNHRLDLLQQLWRCALERDFLLILNRNQLIQPAFSNHAPLAHDADFIAHFLHLFQQVTG